MDHQSTSIPESVPTSATIERRAGAPKGTRLLRRPAVEALTGDSRAKIYEDMLSGEMVRPIHVAVNKVLWVEDEVQTIIDARVGGASPAQLRMIVGKLHAARPQRLAQVLEKVLGPEEAHRTLAAPVTPQPQKRPRGRPRKHAAQQVRAPTASKSTSPLESVAEVV